MVTSLDSVRLRYSALLGCQVSLVVFARELALFIDKDIQVLLIVNFVNFDLEFFEDPEALLSAFLLIIGV